MRLWIVAGLLIAPGVSAQAVRVGAAAYGDWRSDAPGVIRLIRPSDLPQPGETPSVSLGPRVVPRPPGVLPRVPPGFSVQIWATGFEMPRALRVAPNGDVFLAESGAGRIRVFRPQPEGEHPGPAATFATGLDEPFGIAFWPPDAPRFVYIAETSRVLRYPYDGGLRPVGPAETVIAQLPQGGHWTRDLAADPNGSALYLSVGSASNVAPGMHGMPQAEGTAAIAGAATGDESGRAEVFTFAPDGSSLKNYCIRITQLRVTRN